MNTFQRRIGEQLKSIKTGVVQKKGSEVDFAAVYKDVETLQGWIKAYKSYLEHQKKRKEKVSQYTRPHCGHCNNNHHGTCIPLLMKKGLKASAPIGFSKNCTQFTPTKEYENCYSPEVMEKIRGGNYGN